ncbi:hypothetical protein HYALB_00010323 [Hymenoscyphus albidus]|uniref:Uncharacterized protein n=1 Tax=Hymenoscyphus albidus TaxID=595503 RepID=A0A9N9LP42_9HELO|nr:hypothetical protein HYALB_00010323 [Hymenoscyphus albidus]
MAPGLHVEILKNKSISFVSEDGSNGINADDDEDFVTFKYYHSTRVLGKLFDAVDENEVIKRLHNNRISKTTSSRKHWNRTTSLLHHISLWMESFYKTDPKMPGKAWEIYKGRARAIREEHEASLLDLMFQYGPSPHLPISEIEVFIGNILGKAGAPTSRQREISMSMKERFEDLFSLTVKRMTLQDEYFFQNEPLAIDCDILSVRISTACFWCFFHDKPKAFDSGKKGSLDLRSFGYVAAAMCLKLRGRIVST